MSADLRGLLLGHPHDTDRSGGHHDDQGSAAKAGSRDELSVSLDRTGLHDDSATVRCAGKKVCMRTTGTLHLDREGLRRRRFGGKEVVAVPGHFGAQVEESLRLGKETPAEGTQGSSDAMALCGYELWSTESDVCVCVDRIHTNRSQCVGSPIRMRVETSASRSSTRKLLVLATQLAVVVPLSSTRSPVERS